MRKRVMAVLLGLTMAAGNVTAAFAADKVVVEKETGGDSLKKRYFICGGSFYWW